MLGKAHAALIVRFLFKIDTASVLVINGMNRPNVSPTSGSKLMPLKMKKLQSF